MNKLSRGEGEGVVEDGSPSLSEKGRSHEECKIQEAGTRQETR
jgi:hypothetical protein